MKTLTTSTIDLKAFGYLESYVSPFDERLFEISPLIGHDWQLLPHRRDCTGIDIYNEMLDKNLVSSMPGLPTLKYYENNQSYIPELWIGNRILGFKGTVFHRDQDIVAPYLDCRDVTQIYIGFFRLKYKLFDHDLSIVSITRTCE
jgi:hypothetical protein